MPIARRGRFQPLVCEAGQCGALLCGTGLAAVQQAAQVLQHVRSVMLPTCSALCSAPSGEGKRLTRPGRDHLLDRALSVGSGSSPIRGRMFALRPIAMRTLVSRQGSAGQRSAPSASVRSSVASARLTSPRTYVAMYEADGVQRFE